MTTQTTYDINISITANIDGDVKRGLDNLISHQKAEIKKLLTSYYPSAILGFDIEAETFLDDRLATYVIKD